LFQIFPLSADLLHLTLMSLCLTKGNERNKTCVAQILWQFWFVPG